MRAQTHARTPSVRVIGGGEVGREMRGACERARARVTLRVGHQQKNNVSKRHTEKETENRWAGELKLLSRQYTTSYSLQCREQYGLPLQMVFKILYTSLLYTRSYRLAVRWFSLIARSHLKHNYQKKLFALLCTFWFRKIMP